LKYARRPQTPKGDLEELSKSTKHLGFQT